MARRSRSFDANTSARSQLEQQRALLNLLSVTAATANQAAAPELALQQALDQIALHTGWPVSHVYLQPDVMVDELVPSAIWHLDSPQQYSVFQHTTNRTIFRPGLGLVGLVQATARPVWVADVMADERFIRRHPDLDLGVRTGALFPLLIGDDVAGVIECYTPEVIEPDPSLLEVLANVGAILGRVLERIRIPKTVGHTAHFTAAHLQGIRRDAANQIAAMFAHEINNPLYAARNALELISRNEPSPESAFLGVIHQELTRIAEVMKRMRSFAPPPRGQLILTDIRSLIAEAIAESSITLHQPPLVIRTMIAPGVPQLHCDRLQLQLVLGHLIANAIDAMPEGGELTIQVASEDDRMIITVSDTGPGIPPDIVPNIFEPFFTTKPGRSGLGLSIATQIIAQHNGQLAIIDATPPGAVFQIILPLQPSELR